MEFEVKRKYSTWSMSFVLFILKTYVMITHYSSRNVPIKLIIVIKNVQNGARKPHTKNNIYIPHPYLYTFMQRADTVLCVFLPCRVAAKQNEASESGDSVRTLDRTKEPLGERSPLFEIDQFFVSPIRDKFYAPVLCV